MANLCIIPARGGSKRIPRKNIKSFLGKPIISYSILTAIASNLFDEVMVSTDDLEISEVATSFGAKVPFLRSEKTSNDISTTFEVLNEVIYRYKIENLEFENICCIYPCAPLININKLASAYNLLNEKKFDTVFPVIRSGFPIQRYLQIDHNSRVSFFYPELALTRTQDLPPSFHDAGQFYWINTKACLKEQMLITSNTGCIEISEIEGHDIDNEVDWKLAELKYEFLQSTK